MTTLNILAITITGIQTILALYYIRQTYIAKLKYVAFLKGFNAPTEIVNNIDELKTPQDHYNLGMGLYENLRKINVQLNNKN